MTTTSTSKKEEKLEKDQIRISFQLDLTNRPEFEVLRNMNGHGDRPRELLRLAKLGLEYEQKRSKIMERLHDSSLEGMSKSLAASALEAQSEKAEDSERKNTASPSQPKEPAKAPPARQMPTHDQLPESQGTDDEGERAQAAAASLPGGFLA